MPPPSLPILQKLHRLDKSSSRFHDQLSNLLYGEEYRQCVPNLQGDDLLWFVDYLDRALSYSDPPSSAFRKCLRELRSICCNKGVLPASYTLPPDLLNVDPVPFASGGFGDVHKGTFDGSRVCSKRVRVYTQHNPQKAARAICREAVIWKHLMHPNIVPLLGITVTPFQLISVWMPGGDLPGHIRTNPNADRLKLLSDVAEGLNYLHTYNVIHGDLKGPNVLIDAFGDARIVDFGFATVTQNLDSVRSLSCQGGQTLRWSAPEVLNGERHSEEADIFAFAMVMVEVFTGAIPFSDKSTAVAMMAIMQGRRPPRPTHPTFTENLWALMQRCWHQEPRSRPEVSQVLELLGVPGDPAWKRLISLTADSERTALITEIFLDHDQVEVAEGLSGDDAQAFVDAVDGVLDFLPPEIRSKCLHCLRRICDHQALLPRSLAIPLCYDPRRLPLAAGGSVDMQKGQHKGLEVAAKGLRLYPKDNLRAIKGRFCKEVVTWKILRHQNLLPLIGVTMTENLLVVASEWMVRGNIMEFVKADASVDRAQLLGDATMGLMYMHSQGITHGNLKGVNVLINNDGRACLTGFNPFTIASDQSTITPSSMTSDAIRRLSPERLHPEDFNLSGSRPTKESDCYALGMMIYEVLSGLTPFFSCVDTLLVIKKILDGERPKKPRGEEGAWFTAGLWELLEVCWKPKPDDRPTLDAVLRHLQYVTPPSRPPGGRLGRVVNGSAASTHTYPPVVSSPTSQLGGGGFPAPPQQGSSQGGWVGRFIRNTWNTVFEALTWLCCGC